MPLLLEQKGIKVCYCIACETTNNSCLCGHNATSFMALVHTVNFYDMQFINIDSHKFGLLNLEAPCSVEVQRRYLLILTYCIVFGMHLEFVTNYVEFDVEAATEMVSG